MSGHEESDFNKIAKGVLFAGVLAMVAGFIADGLYNPKTPEKTAFAIEIPEVAEAGAEAVAVVEVDVNELMLTADAARGEALAQKKCAACHTFNENGPHKTGPNLHSSFGKKIASKGEYPTPGEAAYSYSSALKAVEGNWDYETMNQWLKNPQAFAKGSKMVLKTPKDAERADIIKYLESIR